MPGSRKPPRKAPKRKAALQKRPQPRFDAAEIERKALPSRLQKVFAQYHGFFLKLALPLARHGIPIAILHEYCMMHSRKYAKRFNPDEGTRFSTWITNGWKIALKNAQQDFQKGAYQGMEKRIHFQPPEELSRAVRGKASTEPLPLEAAITREQQGKLRQAFSRLPPQEQFVLQERFGFGTTQEKKHTNLEIAEKMGISHETVRKIGIRALRKLRNAIAKND